MNGILLLLIISIIFITIGAVRNINVNECNDKSIDIRVYPRNVYDSIISDSIL